MWKQNDVVAVLASDLHISPTPPIARSVEKDWYEVQANYLSQVDDLCDLYDCPFVVAGDVFNKPTVPAECVNFTMKYLPKRTLAVPGQHDLPNHRYEDLKKSSFYTLVLSKNITLLESDKLEPNSRIRLKNNWFAYGYPWGFDIDNDIDKEPDEKALAVIHSYIWWKDNKYEGAPREKNLNKWSEKLNHKGFDAAVFGDNHKGFFVMAEENGDPWIMNCGTFIRRNIDEINYQPRVGILRQSGRIDEYNLECSTDKFIEVGDALKAIESAMEGAEFIQELSGLGKTLVDFVEAVQRFCFTNGIDKRVVEVITKSLEKK